MTDAQPGVPPVADRLEAFLRQRGGHDRTRAVPLTGDASDRRYYRLIRQGHPTVIAAVHAEPFQCDTLPFLNVARLLRQMAVPVPAILDHADELGVLLLEDLGDDTLQAHLGACTADERDRRYAEAVDLLTVIQREGARLASADYTPYGQAFDRGRLTWELDYFVRHFVEGYRGVPVPNAVRTALDEQWRTLADELASEPRVLCHRDYHSRNLMVHKGRLHVIDFQDARMGPDTYDLVSLLRDSYVDVPDDLVDASIRRFLSARGHPDGAQAFRARFDMMALQRNLKALGTFGYQTIVRGNPVYIQFMARTLHHVGGNLRRHTRFRRLGDLLGGLIDELR